MFTGIILLVNLLSSFHVILSSSDSSECSVNNSDKLDCGYVGITQSLCESKNCCWVPVSYTSTNNLQENIPWCFYKAGVTVSSCFLLNSNNNDNTNTINSIPPFSTTEINSFRNNYLKNINIDNKGGVVAAPDTNTPGGSYYYHWMRDAALTMRRFLLLLYKYKYLFINI